MSACPICNRPVDPGRSSYQQVTGYVKPRKAGGANQIRKSTPTGVYAHADCVEDRQPEVIPGQLTLTTVSAPVLE